MKERRKQERRKFIRRSSDQDASKIGKIYKVGTKWNAEKGTRDDEAIIRILRFEGDYVIHAILAESTSDSKLELGYKFHRNYRLYKEAEEVPERDLPLYMSWPRVTMDYFRALKGEPARPAPSSPEAPEG